MIAEQIGTLRRQSALYYSEPWGFQSNNLFVNAVVCVATTLTPRQLLQTTQHIEQQLGKTSAHATLHYPLNRRAIATSETEEPSTIYHDRPIDIDILLYDNLNIDEPDLVIPHPMMHQRPFVVEPLNTIDHLLHDPILTHAPLLTPPKGGG